jgi:hypothetical protein
VTNSTYVWNTGRSSFDEAEATCNSYGGHLAAWNNAEEQQEVEVGRGAGRRPSLHPPAPRLRPCPALCLGAAQAPIQLLRV